MCDATLLCDNAYQCSATQGNLYIASSIYNRPMVTTKLRDKLSSLDAERDALTQRLDAEVDQLLQQPNATKQAYRRRIISRHRQTSLPWLLMTLEPCQEPSFVPVPVSISDPPIELIAQHERRGRCLRDMALARIHERRTKEDECFTLEFHRGVSGLEMYFFTIPPGKHRMLAYHQHCLYIAKI